MAKSDFTSQLKNFNSKLPFWQKGLIFGSAALILGGLIYMLVAGTNSKNYAVLYGDLNNTDAGKIVEKLKEKKIDYQFAENGSTILVDKEKLYDARLSLAAEGLPESGSIGFELFDKTNLGMSEYVQKINYRRAQEGELARTILSLDQIKSVRVHIVIPDKALFEKDQKKPTAVVSLHFKNDKMGQKINIEGIQNLVASSIEGMTPGDVNVIDSHGRILSVKANDRNSVAGISEFQMEQQLKFEQYLAGKVQSMLDNVIGGGNSEVRVNALLDFTQKAETKTEYNPDQVPRSEQTTTDIYKTTDPNTIPTEGTGLVQPSVDKQTTNSVMNYEITKTETKKVDEVGAIKRLTVSVLINGNHKVMHNNKVKPLQSVPSITDDIDKLKDIVKNTIGFDPSRNDQISISMVPFDFNDVDNPSEEPIVQQWYLKPENLKLFVLIAAIIIVMFLIYGILNSRPVRERMRLALNLPDKVSIEDDDVNLETLDDEKLDRLIFDSDDMLLLPAELPDQLLLDGDRTLKQIEDFESDGETFDSRSLADKAFSTENNLTSGMKEETMMKLELKNKIEEYLDVKTMEAVKLIRILLAQDVEEKTIKLPQL